MLSRMSTVLLFLAYCFVDESLKSSLHTAFPRSTLSVPTLVPSAYSSLGRPSSPNPRSGPLRVRLDAASSPS